MENRDNYLEAFKQFESQYNSKVLQEYIYYKTNYWGDDLDAWDEAKHWENERLYIFFLRAYYQADKNINKMFELLDEWDILEKCLDIYINDQIQFLNDNYLECCSKKQENKIKIDFYNNFGLDINKTLEEQKEKLIKVNYDYINKWLKEY